MMHILPIYFYCVLFSIKTKLVALPDGKIGSVALPNVEPRQRATCQKIDGNLH